MRLTKILICVLTLGLTPTFTLGDDDPFVIDPYLQLGKNPAPDSWQLLWHAADTDTEWAVETRHGDVGAWTRSAAPTFRRVAVGTVPPHRVYNVTLSGLEPGCAFQYRVLKAGQPVFSAEGKGPKRANQAIRYVVVGDCGAGTSEQKPLARRILESKPDMVVITGDIVYEYGLVSEYKDKFWNVYNANTTTDEGAPLLRSIPFVAAPGNHDTDTRDLEKYPDALAYYMYLSQPLNGPLFTEGSPVLPAVTGPEQNKRAFLEAAGPNFPRMTNFSFNSGNVHWTVIDSNPYVDFTDPAIQDWVKADLEAAKDAQWRFIAFHHPGLQSAREHFEQQHMRLLSPIFEAGKADAVFMGHVHNYQRTFPMTFLPDKKGTLLVGGRDGKTVRGRVVNGKWTLDKAFDGKRSTKPKGVIYIVTGAGGQKLYNPEQNDDPDSWQKFTDKFRSNVHSITVADIDGNTATIRQVTADGTEIDSFQISK